MTGECIAVVSGKGGTGKTSFTSAAAASIAMDGKKVLCIDCDIALRNLDLPLGLTDSVLMDFSDVCRGTCSLSDAVAESHEISGLYLLTAPSGQFPVDITPDDMGRLLDAVREEYDYCFLDAPAGLELGFQLAATHADRAVVLSTADFLSLRNAQRAVMALSHIPDGQLHLVVNRVSGKVIKYTNTNIDDAIDAVGAPLLGLVPDDPSVLSMSPRGVKSFLASGSKAAKAYHNIANRLQGRRAPLLRIH